MTPSALVLLIVAAFGLSAWLTNRFCRPAGWLDILDYPNERSLHTRPTPRTGGVAIVATVVIAGSGAALCLAPTWQRPAWLLGAIVLVAVTSFLDDCLGLASGYRMLCHFAAAGTLVVGGFLPTGVAVPGTSFALSPRLGIAITILYIVWMVNLYNFMDGMDGLSGGMAVFGFGAFALLGVSEGQWLFATLNLIVAAAAGGFLVFNFPPARLFMGDTGSSSLGLMAAAFSIWGSSDGIFPFWTAVLVFSVFIVDATVTLVRRAARGEKVWQAHKAHYYQRLVQLGWGHRKTVLWEYCLMAACVASALASRNAGPATQWRVIGFWMGAYIAIAVAVRQLEQRARQ